MSDKKTATGVSRNLPDSYEDLCQQIAFPRPIKDAVDYENTLEIVERLITRPELTDGQAEYLDAITTFVEKFEASEAPFTAASALEVLRHLVNANGMSPSELSKLLGDESRSLGSRLLSGERDLSKAHIARLCEHFGVSADVFISARARSPIPDGTGVVPPRGWVHREISIWEAIADVCEQELARRPHADGQERHLVYLAALTCANSRPSADHVISIKPELKGLPELQRLIDTYIERLAARLAESGGPEDGIG